MQVDRKRTRGGSVSYVGLLSMLCATLVVSSCMPRLPVSGQLAPSDVPSSLSIRQGVYGYVVARLGGDLSTATVQAREYRGRYRKAGTVVASTTARSDGYYELELPGGIYFILVADAEVCCPLSTTGWDGKNFAEEDLVHAFEVVVVMAGERINEVLYISQISPQ